jgi:hypothetical protein
VFESLKETGARLALLASDLLASSAYKWLTLGLVYCGADASSLMLRSWVTTDVLAVSYSTLCVFEK